MQLIKQAKCQRDGILAFVILLLCFTGVKTRNTPPIPCPKNFQYITFGDESFALMTLNNLSLGKIVVDINLAQQDPISTSFSGSLSLNQNHLTTQTNLERGSAISYRIDFPNPKILPILLEIKVNGDTICSELNLKEPGNVFKLQHIFEPVVSTTEMVPTTFPNDIFPYQESFVAPMIKSQIPEIFEPTYNECGGERLTPNTNITYENEYRRGRLPWHVAIYVKESGDFKFKCDALLISSRSIITTAHCLPTSHFSFDSLSIFLGFHNLLMNEQYSNQRGVSSLSFHLNNSSNWEIDIVLLHMDVPIEFNDHIRPICLWSHTVEPLFLQNQKAFTLKSGINYGDESSLLKSKIVNESDCAYSNLYGILTSSRGLCVRFESDSGPCINSGSDLMIKIWGEWILSGIRSKIHSCELSQYIVFYDVSKLTSWIRENMLS